MTYAALTSLLVGEFVELAALIAVLVLAGSMIPGNPGIMYYR